jgi:glycosyltransferase involved in cell wall biosynthesis
MIDKKIKIVFISTESTPRMIKFAACMATKVKFHLFFSTRPINRPFFWSKYKLNQWCSIEKGSLILFGRSYNLNIIKKTIKINPDILILGGFFEITNFILYLWGIKNNKKIIVFSEPFWSHPLGKKRKFWQKQIIAKIFVKFLYCKIKSILAVGDQTKLFFTEFVGINESKVYSVTYPVDIENHLNHELRTNKKNLIFLFPHRLIDLYNPIMCLKWFIEIQKYYTDTNLLLNGHGYLRKKIEKIIIEHKLQEKIKFADNITSWDNMANIYKNSDIMISTKSVSHTSEWSVAEIESFASGLGIIAFRNSKGLSSAIDKSKSGFIIDDINDLKSVKDAVSKYINTNGLITQHGKLNRIIVEKFSTESMVNKYLEIISIDD